VRVIQNSLTKLEINVVIDEKLRNIGPSIDKIFSVLKTGFKEKLGSEVEILLKEVNKIDKENPRFISKVDRSKLQITGYA
jgi:hypothetical protein